MKGTESGKRRRVLTGGRAGPSFPKVVVDREMTITGICRSYIEVTGNWQKIRETGVITRN